MELQVPTTPYFAIERALAEARSLAHAPGARAPSWNPTLGHRPVSDVHARSRLSRCVDESGNRTSLSQLARALPDPARRYPTPIAT